MPGQDGRRELYDALRGLEGAARAALAADQHRAAEDRRPPRYSRNAAAAEVTRVVPGFHASRIKEWLSHDYAVARRPTDFDVLWTLIGVWGAWAGQKPDRGRWNGLWTAAGHRRPATPGAPQPGSQQARSSLAMPQPREQVMLGVPVEEALVAGPVAYEVHPAIQAWDNAYGADSDAGMQGMPVYLQRAHDELLAAVVADAVTGSSRMAVLVGEPSTGKTRTCWETLQGLPAGWRLWHPLTVAELLTGLEPSPNGPVLATRTVIWLNELQRYLPPQAADVAEQAGAALRRLLRDRTHGPVLVLASIWSDTDRWGVLTAEPAAGRPDRYAQARQLLTGAAITVPDRIDDARVGADAAAKRDPRWRLALREDPNRPIQFLAGGRYLLERHRTADPSHLAVLDAAGDARRLGGSGYLPLAFLERAARGYLSDARWDAISPDHRCDWVRDVIEDPQHGLARPGRGIRGPLYPTGDPSGDQSPVYDLADYLEHHLRRTRGLHVPPSSFWEAAERLGSDDTYALGVAAQRRGRLRHAARLFEVGIRRGDRRAMLALALLRDENGDRSGAEPYYRAAEAASTDPKFLTHLAVMQEAYGRRHEGCVLLKSGSML